MGDRFHYIAVFKINEDNELNRYLLNMTFRAGSDEPEDTDNAMYLIETYEDYSEEKLKKVIEKVNSLLDTFNDDKEAKDIYIAITDKKIVSGGYSVLIGTPFFDAIENIIKGGNSKNEFEISTKNQEQLHR